MRDSSITTAAAPIFIIAITCGDSIFHVKLMSQKESGQGCTSCTSTPSNAEADVAKAVKALSADEDATDKTNRSAERREKREDSTNEKYLGASSNDAAEEEYGGGGDRANRGKHCEAPCDEDPEADVLKSVIALRLWHFTE